MTDQATHVLPLDEQTQPQQPPRRKKKLLLGLSCAFSLAAACVLAWPVGYFISSAQVLGSLSAAAIGGGLLALALVTRLLGKPGARRYVAAGIVIATLALTYPLHKLVLQYEVHRAQAYCEGLQPGLEAHARQHGEYPAHVGNLLPPTPPPRLLLRGFYRNLGNSYAFFITCGDATGPDGYYYHSATKTWRSYN